MEFMISMQETGMDVEQTLRRFSGNRALFERFIRKFPSDTTYSALEKAVRAENPEEILRAAHTLKGISANLGFEALSARCAEMVSSIREGCSDQAKRLPQFLAVEKEYLRIVGLISNAE